MKTTNTNIEITDDQIVEMTVAELAFTEYKKWLMKSTSTHMPFEKWLRRQKGYRPLKSGDIISSDDIVVDDPLDPRVPSTDMIGVIYAPKYVSMYRSHPKVLTAEDIASFRDAHADRTYEDIAKLDRLAVESEAQAIRIVVTNAK